MVFSSLLFLCRFLPIVLLIYYIAPASARNLVLFISSLVFYAWGEPVYVFIMLFSTVFDYCIGRWIDYSRRKGKQNQARLGLICSIFVNLAILGVFKYSDFAIGTVNSVIGTDFSSPELPLPIGISFYTFQTMSYSIDVYRGKTDMQKNIINFGAYVAMFPQLIAGPIVRYKTIAEELNHRRENQRDFSDGVIRFVTGLGKKVLLANTIGSLFTELSSQTRGLTTANAWLGIIAFTFQIYFDFSGYSDMAIGLGKMFGFHFLENFDYPYQSKSITEFWRRWHISLGTFFREYVYYPLGGNRKGKARQMFNILVVWMLTGLWHGASWNFVIWGIYYAALLVIEKLFLGKLLKKAPPVVSHIYTMLLVMFGWAIFTVPDMADSTYYFSAMLGMGDASFADSSTLYYLANYIVLFVCCIFASTALPKKTASHLVKEGKSRTVMQCVFIAVVAFFCIMSLVSDTYNPFLYFRF